MIEAKHLISYLGTKLKMQWHHGEIGVLKGIEYVEPDNAYFENGVMLMISTVGSIDSAKTMPARLGQMKPILRNMSDIDKEIEHNGERFSFFNDVSLLEGYCDAYDEYIDHVYDFQDKPHEVDWLQAPFAIVNYALKWHFNVYNIDKEFWVNYNDVEL